jgi:hypothetical protein
MFGNVNPASYTPQLGFPDFKMTGFGDDGPPFPIPDVPDVPKNKAGPSFISPNTDVFNDVSISPSRCTSGF